MNEPNQNWLVGGIWEKKANLINLRMKMSG